MECQVTFVAGQKVSLMFYLVNLFFYRTHVPADLAQETQHAFQTSNRTSSSASVQRALREKHVQSVSKHKACRWLTCGAVGKPVFLNVMLVDHKACRWFTCGTVGDLGFGLLSVIGHFPRDLSGM